MSFDGKDAQGPAGPPPEPDRWFFYPWEKRFQRLVSPFEEFIERETTSGLVLIAGTIVALLLANSVFRDAYETFMHTRMGITVGAWSLHMDLLHWINEGLMVVFFFVVGLEIRREIYRGELSEWRRAALPVVAALGGVLAPVAIYLAIAGGPATRSGWAVPMATDIAFAVGILTLLGKRVPPALRVLLLAVAVIDDLEAILVIALFYSSGISLGGLGVTAIGVLGLFALRWLGVRAKPAYVVPGVVVWAGVYAAGIHPTIAGVLVGVLTPVRPWLGPEGLVNGVRHEVDRLSKVPTGDVSAHQLSETVRRVEFASREAMAPADSLIEALHPWVAFVIMPVFALANAGVAVSVAELDETSWSLIAAIGLGLIVGKPLGIFLASWALLRVRLGTLPTGMTMKHVAVLGVVGGVGFTMALFIAQLAFADAHRLGAAKLGVLAASAGAASLAVLLGRLLLSSVPSPGAAPTADEAEGS